MKKPSKYVREKVTYAYATGSCVVLEDTVDDVLEELNKTGDLYEAGNKFDGLVIIEKVPKHG
jgi:hypothetical protein